MPEVGLRARFSPWFMSESHGLDPAEVVAAVVEGVQQASSDTGLPVCLIGILSRTYGVEIAWKELAALLTQREAITALDLAGDEAHYPGELFVKHFKQARDAGWHITVHAGEIAGPQSVWQAIRGGAERISRRARPEPGLMDYLAEHRIDRVQPDQQRADQHRGGLCQPPAAALPGARYTRHDQLRRPRHQRHQPAARV
jgi:adenosine deaminase